MKEKDKKEEQSPLKTIFSQELVSPMTNLGFIAGTSGPYVISPDWNKVTVGNFPYVISTSDPTLDSQLELQKEIDSLRKELRDTSSKMEKEKSDKEKIQKAKEEFEQKNNELQKKESLRHLITRVNERA